MRIVEKERLKVGRRLKNNCNRQKIEVKRDDGCGDVNSRIRLNGLEKCVSQRTKKERI